MTLTFRDRDLVLALFDYIADIEEGQPATWVELITVFGTEGDRPPKTVENALYELIRFGALHRIGRPGTRRRRDTRALVATPLGKAWRDGTVPGLPQEPDDPIEAADHLAHEHAVDVEGVTTTIGETP